MKYFIALFYLVGSIYAQCNADNWEKFYNSDCHDMEGCYLEGAAWINANLENANLQNADLTDAFLGGANLSGANLKMLNLREPHL